MRQTFTKSAIGCQGLAIPRNSRENGVALSLRLLMQRYLSYVFTIGKIAMYVALMTLAVLTAINPVADTNAKEATQEAAIKAKAKECLQAVNAIQKITDKEKQIVATIAFVKKSFPPMMVQCGEEVNGLKSFSKRLIANQINDLVTAFKDIQDKKPAICEEGNKATFQLTKKAGHQTSVTFIKAKGKWYFQPCAGG